jgi:hypothetical protein
VTADFAALPVEVQRIVAELTRIGTVEILRARTYPLDVEAHDDIRSTVIVEPGVFDLFSDGMTTFWMMRGQLNERGPWRLGDGMFSMSGGDRPSGIEVVFPSKRFGPDEWAELLTEPNFTEGHPEQRLRVTLTTEPAPARPAVQALQSALCAALWQRQHVTDAHAVASCTPCALALGAGEHPAAACAEWRRHQAIVDAGIGGV